MRGSLCDFNLVAALLVTSLAVILEIGRSISDSPQLEPIEIDETPRSRRTAMKVLATGGQIPGRSDVWVTRLLSQLKLPAGRKTRFGDR